VRVLTSPQHRFRRRGCARRFEGRERRSCPFPVWPSRNGLITAITRFMSFPLTVRACGAQDPAASTKLRRAKSQSPPASNAGAKESNGVPSRWARCAQMEEFQRETGKFGGTDLIETPRSGCERPTAFASDGHQFRISPLRLVPALRFDVSRSVILLRSRLARAGREPAL
jgi:hypothetical protein